MVQGQGRSKRQPEEYMKYFEDWLFASDAEIGPYNYFGIASNYPPPVSFIHIRPYNYMDKGRP
jgi:hypothetical protein